MRPTTRSRRVAAVAALAVPALALTACGSGSDSKASSSSSSATSSSASVLAKGFGATVSGTAAKPTLKLDNGKYSTKTTESKVVKEGTGPVVKSGDKTAVKLLVVTGTNGATVYDDFAQGSTQSMPLGTKQALTGISKALIGKKVGSLVLAAVPPADGFGATGQPALKITKDDTLVMLMEIVRVLPTPLKEATGTPVAPKAGFPTVSFTYGKPATITVPKTTAPKTTQQETLIEGNGAVVKKGQTIAVHYTGVLWKDGKKFDSSFDRGTEPTEFPIGAGQVIKAWDETLVGKKVGSRVVIVAPPADAYGSQARGPIPANSTLAFVVDILSAY